MTSYTFSEARQKFATVLDKAKKEGEVLIKRKDGKSFIVKPLKKTKSPLDVGGVELSLAREEIIDIIRESRQK